MEGRRINGQSSLHNFLACDRSHSPQPRKCGAMCSSHFSRCVRQVLLRTGTKLQRNHDNKFICQHKRRRLNVMLSAEKGCCGAAAVVQPTTVHTAGCGGAAQSASSTSRASTAYVPLYAVYCTHQ
jgi:hypothetical protein